MPGFDLSHIPAAPPPPGVIPNFIDPPSRANMPRIFTYVTLPPMILFLAMRMYVRIFVTHKIGLDDYLCALGSAIFITYTVLLFTILDNPSGPHQWDVPASKMTTYFVRTSILTSLLFMVAAMFVKAAILALYRRIFSPSRFYNALILSGLAFTFVSYTSVLVALAVGCIPRSRDYANGGWLSLQYRERCNTYNPASTATSGVVGAVIDIYILLLPLFFVFQLQTSKRRKAGLAAIFVVGSSACVFSIFSAYYRFDIITASVRDLTWGSMPIYSWSIAEINVGVLCSCIPVAFIMFNGITEKYITWANHFWNGLTHGYRKTPDSNDAKKYQVNHSRQDQAQYIHNLPQVPKATMTGVLSFIDRIGRSKAEKTQATVYTDELNLTMMSVDHDYHDQLRAGLTDGRT